MFLLIIFIIMIVSSIALSGVLDLLYDELAAVHSGIALERYMQCSFEICLK